MKPLPNEIVLRPRFQLHIPKNKEIVLSRFQQSKENPFLVKRLDEHVFIKFNQKEHHFWSPQLHLEIDEVDDISCKLYGVFGPNPTLWTFFMFVHFIVATLFIIIGIWAYSSASLGKNYHIQVGLMVLLVLIWFVLYFAGRSGKKKGEPQMQQLLDFMQNVLTA
ncbi:GTP-binding protein [Maribacter sp. SA7]|uniref:GTP-binding protein n=1 Tax=Maribacter zhoushanensis TaxID=3030012 RepID=UPI0023EA845F|nr:GTP-binding protein [Maribacter zhoushanensis]MDF4204387.1 GTP-binding protein [Maribacter zhoushanensis]